MFFAPVMEPVTEAVDVPLSQVRKGTKVLGFGGEMHTVGEIKTGSKYITVLSDEGVTLVKAEKTDKSVLVSVERETQWSQEVRAEAIHVNRVNERLREKAAEHKDNEKTKAALAKLTEQAYDGYVADSFRMDELVKAQAQDEVFGRFYHAVKNALEKNPDVNLVEFVEEYKKELLRQFTVHFRGLSKSTSQVSNLMDDARNEVIVKFLDRDMLWVL